MKTKNSASPEGEGLNAPAFLSSSRGFVPSPAPRQSIRGWTPPAEVRRVEGLVGTLPKLTASLGLALAARPDVMVEMLPGTPTTVVYSSGGQLCGMLVLPVDNDEVSRLVGLPAVQTKDIVVDQLWEECRQADAPTPESLLDDFTTWQP